MTGRGIYNIHSAAELKSSEQTNDVNNEVDANADGVTVSEGLAISALVNEGNGGSSVVPGITAKASTHRLVYN